MVRIWRRYDLRCRDCGNVGSLGVGSDYDNGMTTWNYEWVGFIGTVEKEQGPREDTIICLLCQGRNVRMDKRG